MEPTLVLLSLLALVEGYPNYYYRGYPQYQQAWGGYQQYYPRLYPPPPPPPGQYYPPPGQFYPQSQLPYYIPEVGAEQARDSLVKFPDVVYVDAEGNSNLVQPAVRVGDDGGCDKLQCYYDCRLALTGGGECGRAGQCQCYQQDGLQRRADNIWWELSQTQQQHIKAAENDNQDTDLGSGWGEEEDNYYDQEEDDGDDEEGWWSG